MIRDDPKWNDHACAMPMFLIINDLSTINLIQSETDFCLHAVYKVLNYRIYFFRKQYNRKVGKKVWTFSAFKINKSGILEDSFNGH
jgi:hypothetical protein